MTRLSLLIDVTKCSGCHNCFLACRDEYYDNDYSPYSAPQPLDGQFWMQVKEVERGSYPKPKLDYIPMPCMHCEKAPCIDAAADEAVYRRKDGIVIIDPKKAKGQKAIVNSCPYRVVFWNAELELPQKCTLCAHRLDRGRQAAALRRRPARPAPWSSAIWTTRTARSPSCRRLSRPRPTIPSTGCRRRSSTWASPSGSSPAKWSGGTFPASAPRA